jgi:hypothetical protein
MNLEKEVERLGVRVSELKEQNGELRSQLQNLELRSQLHCFEFEGEKALDKEIDDTLNERGLPNDFIHFGNGVGSKLDMVIFFSFAIEINTYTNNKHR